jgi:hypothetical protein
MTAIRTIKLEILRSGPDHNQLLSPLTPYLALCGADGPVTLTLPFEQRQLLSRLERLRYYIRNTVVAPEQREAELREMGELIGKILGLIPALLAELGSVQPDRGQLVHLRLSLAAFELGFVPFETAIAPEGFPASGSPLLLQSNIPITMTREVRHGRPLPVAWDRRPRILFAFASPQGLASVPSQNHLIALRRAIDPWVAIREETADKLKAVKDILTVLPDATLDQIRQTCSDTEYTHVHILAHGAPYEYAGERRYGLALCSSADPAETDVVDGERLAIALTSNRATTCNGSPRPTVLSLATCDSGNIGSVLTPGGSIAHELHAAGIPWIFASQFPLWMRASTLFTEVLYKRLLLGADPRCVLHELRQRLRISFPETHDWASIVSYASVPWDFENQVMAFRDRQTRSRIETQFARIDDILLVWKDAPEKKNLFEEEIKNLCSTIRQDLKEWREHPTFSDNPQAVSDRRGIGAASEKRIGMAYAQLQDETKSRQAYQNACDLYLESFKTNTANHWALTQYLSIHAVIKKSQGAGFPDNLGQLWNTARQICRFQLTGAEGLERAWLHASSAELELLGAVYNPETYHAKDAEEEIVRCCKEIVMICNGDSFPVQSTIRQFRRYAGIWGDDSWNDLAEAAIKALESRDTMAVV